MASCEAAGTFGTPRRCIKLRYSGVCVTAAVPSEPMVVVFCFFVCFHVATLAPGRKDHRGALLRDRSQEGVL